MKREQEASLLKIIKKQDLFNNKRGVVDMNVRPSMVFNYSTGRYYKYLSWLVVTQDKRDLQCFIHTKQEGTRQENKDGCGRGDSNSPTPVVTVDLVCLQEFRALKKAIISQMHVAFQSQDVSMDEILRTASKDPSSQMLNYVSVDGKTYQLHPHDDWITFCFNVCYMIVKFQPQNDFSCGTSASTKHSTPSTEADLSSKRSDSRAIVIHENVDPAAQQTTNKPRRKFQPRVHKASARGTAGNTTAMPTSSKLQNLDANTDAVIEKQKKPFGATKRATVVSDKSRQPFESSQKKLLVLQHKPRVGESRQSSENAQKKRVIEQILRVEKQTLQQKRTSIKASLKELKEEYAQYAELKKVYQDCKALSKERKRERQPAVEMKRRRVA